MAYLLWPVAFLLPSVLCVGIVELNQARHLQTDVDMGRPLQHLFETFTHVYNKQYTDDREEGMRKEIFEVNVQYIQEHNKLYAKGEKSYYMGVNHFSDLTHKEFLGMYVGHMKQTFNTSASTYLSPDNVLLPDSVDWRDKGYVTPVKDQGQCGSCWSFSTTGSLEGQHFKKTNVLVSLSEQQLVDCSGSFGNQGCNGGLMDQAFEYIKSAGGLEDEEDYPYTAEDGKKCKFKVSKAKATVTGYVDITPGSEANLQEAVATQGPVSIAIDASHPSFQSYAGGIYDEPSCSSSQLDHGVLVVGYGTDTSPYWLVKNSWSASWGDQGYIKMSRNKKNQCGVATSASYPLV